VTPTLSIDGSTSTCQSGTKASPAQRRLTAAALGLQPSTNQRAARSQISLMPASNWNRHVQIESNSTSDIGGISIVTPFNPPPGAHINCKTLG
jgi:hypothetical protein